MECFSMELHDSDARREPSRILDPNREPTMNVDNYSILYLAYHGIELLDYDGHCDILAAHVLQWVRARLPQSCLEFLEIRPADNLDRLHHKCSGQSWLFHRVPVVNGFVHDAWHPDLLEEWESFPGLAFMGQPTEVEIWPATMPVHAAASGAGLSLNEILERVEWSTDTKIMKSLMDAQISKTRGFARFYLNQEQNHEQRSEANFSDNRRSAWMAIRSPQNE